MDLTPHKVIICAIEEGFALEMYLDSLGNPTWSMGLTAKSGIDVHKYLNRPSTLGEAVQAAVDRMRATYAPQVDRAFGGHILSDAQAAAALSFGWNTGAITTATWVQLWGHGDPAGARSSLENHYTDGTLLKARRMREAALFFDGEWPDSFEVPIWQVAHPSLRIAGKPIDMDIMPILQQILGGK